MQIIVMENNSDVKSGHFADSAPYNDCDPYLCERGGRGHPIGGLAIITRYLFLNNKVKIQKGCDHK